MTPSVATSVLSVGCDLQGSNFFAYATSTNAAQYAQAYIANVTQAVKVALTTPDSNDPTYAVFGYVAGLTKSTFSTVSLSGKVKAGGNMTVYSWCYTNSLVASTSSASYNWIQEDNGGQTYALKALFVTPLTSAHKREMACALVQKLLISSKRVLTDESTVCTTLRLLQNTTNTTNTTTTNTSTSNTSNTTVVTGSYPGYWYVLKDYLAVVDNVSTTLAAQVATSTFLSGLVSGIQKDVDATFPNLTSTYFVATAVSSSVASGSTTVPNCASMAATSSCHKLTMPTSAASAEA
jgi:hypothetical protein